MKRKASLVTTTVRLSRKPYLAAVKRAKEDGISLSMYIRNLLKQHEFDLPSGVATRVKIRKLEKSLEARVSLLESQFKEWMGKA